MRACVRWYDARGEDEGGQESRIDILRWNMLKFYDLQSLQFTKCVLIFNALLLYSPTYIRFVLHSLKKRDA